MGVVQNCLFSDYRIDSESSKASGTAGHLILHCLVFCGVCSVTFWFCVPEKVFKSHCGLDLKI